MDITQNNNVSECPICFDYLFAHPTSVLLNVVGNRICKHFFHEVCINDWIIHNSSCPICKRNCSSIRCIPNPSSEPEEWFNAVDMDGDGKLGKCEVFDVLEAQLPLDSELLRAHIDELWLDWDRDNSGFLTMDELINPENGLINYVKSAFPFCQQQVPDIRNGMRAWFEFWDQDTNGALEKWEVIRALSKTFRLLNNQSSLIELREFKATVEAIWALFDPNSDGKIDINEFCQSDGLGESVIASIVAGS